MMRWPLFFLGGIKEANLYFSKQRLANELKDLYL